MKTLDEYQILLNRDEIERLNKITIQFDANLFIADAEVKNIINDSLTGIYYVKEELNEYNLKINNLDTNYKYLYAYYEKTKGIDLYDNPGKEDITYYHIWFGYECESILSRLIGLVDAIHHIIKANYKIEATSGPGFNKQVLKALKVDNQLLESFIDKHLEDERFDKVRIMRNNFIHNHSPLLTQSMLETSDDNRSFTMKAARGYTTPKEMIEYIKGYRDWLEEFVKELRKYILQ